MQLIAPGLWRWTAPHPAWKPNAAPDSPDDWERDVGCVLYQAPEAAVFVDPLLPEDADTFWAHTDPLVAGRPVFVLTTLAPHRRSREEFAARYKAATSAVPGGVEAIPLHGAAETMYWLPAVRALIAGDRILGDGNGGLRLNPESWMRHLSIGQSELRGLLRPLLGLPVERVVVSHGTPILSGGAAALERLLEA